MAITRTAITDDDGTGTTGTVVDNAWKQELYNQIDAADAAVTTAVTPGSRTETSTGNISALTLPSGSGDLVVYMNNATAATIQGITAGAANQRLTLVSIGAGQVNLTHQNASATAANRAILFATTGSTPLAAGTGTAELFYDSTTSRWRLLTHEQGAWIVGSTPTITGNGAMTISGVSATTAPRWRLSGRTLTWAFDVSFTTGGTANTQVLVALPNSFTGAGASYAVYDKSVSASALAQGQATANLVLFADLTASANWTLAAHRAIATITQDVQ